MDSDHENDNRTLKNVFAKKNLNTKNNIINVNDNKLITKCQCNFDSQIAYIVKNIKDDIQEHITIIEYLDTDHKKLRKYVEKGKKILVCENGNELMKYESNKRKSHFVHKNYSNNEMSEWHKNWQNQFDNIEITIGNRRADAICGNFVLEFQHSDIKKEYVDSRTKNYMDNNKILLWIIDCNDRIIIEDIINNEYILTFKNSWLYEKFIDQEFIYLDINNKIFRINPKSVKCNMINVKEYKTKSDFIKSIKENKNIWNDIDIDNGIIYHNQRGAGCGKTYESIQLMNNDDRFINKEIFIYLTKMHSAVEVVYNEIKSQEKDSRLENLEFDKINGEVGEYENKKYKISYKNKKTNKKCDIFIGTIDSFMFAIGDKNAKGKDYFLEIVKSIKNGTVNVNKNGSITYAKQSVKVNQKCLIVIDEAQDLDSDYIKAFGKIITVTGIDVYVIGDKLQSILFEHNIHTYLEDNKLQGINIQINKGYNIVKRFHNTQFIDFVNNIINYKKYNLFPITGICNAINCKYKHNNDKKPYKIFEIPNIIKDINKIDDRLEEIVEKVLKYMKKQIKKHNYLPNNFMFIFPILKQNFLANRLEATIQNFWITQFENSKYRKKVLVKNNYWKNKLDNSKYNQYIYMHKSDEGKSINLKESENMTRILSIHSSKGNGCEVVFLFGLSESALNKFSKKTGNLIYDSLLHVAITRQKQSLYIGLENINDDIRKRFSNMYIETTDSNKPFINDISKHINYEKIIDFSFQNDDNFNKINNTIIIPNNYKNILDNEQNSIIIDMGHHTIRFHVMYYNLLSLIVENETIESDDENKDYDQFKTILKKISKLKIYNCKYKDYYKKINQITDNNKKKDRIDTKEIPVLCFDTDDNTKYNKYTKIIEKFMKCIQQKIITSNPKLPILCPLETVILWHMIYIHENGKYADIHIMDLYSIMYCYDDCSNSIDEEHNNHFKCICKNEFTEGNNTNDTSSYKEIRDAITKHYEKNKQIKTIYDNYKKYIKDLNDKSTFKYNILHTIWYGSENENFQIFYKYKIIAYSDKHVIQFIIKPQFNTINFNEIICNALLSKFMILNTKKGNNHKKYNNKKIITCIITLDSDKPIFYELNIDKNNNELKNIIKEYLICEYSSKHETIYDLYIFCKKTKPDNMNSFEYIISEFPKQTPKYIKDYFDNINNMIKKNKSDKSKLLENVNDKNIFLKNMNDELYKAIDNFLLDDSDNDY
jgi:hypothetical protein